MEMMDRGLSEEQRLMRETCRGFVNDLVIPFMRRNWQREWLMDPDARLPREILEQADRIGIRTLGVPEEFGGIQQPLALPVRSEEHTSELQSLTNLVCRLLLEK